MGASPRGSPHRQCLIRGASIGEIEATESPGEQVELDTTFQPSGTAIGGVATAAPGAGERVGQGNGRTIVDADTGKTLEQRDGHGIRRDDLLGDPLGDSR